LGLFQNYQFSFWFLTTVEINIFLMRSCWLIPALKSSIVRSLQLFYRLDVGGFQQIPLLWNWPLLAEGFSNLWTIEDVLIVPSIYEVLLRDSWSPSLRILGNLRIVRYLFLSLVNITRLLLY